MYVSMDVWLDGCTVGRLNECIQLEERVIGRMYSCTAGRLNACIRLEGGAVGLMYGCTIGRLCSWTAE